MMLGEIRITEVSQTNDDRVLGELGAYLPHKGHKVFRVTIGNVNTDVTYGRNSGQNRGQFLVVFVTYTTGSCHMLRW